MFTQLDSELVKKLIIEQYPEFAHLPIQAVANQGHDNRTFHLGEEMLVRLPSAEDYAEQPNKEQKWLPFLAKHISVPIPAPILIGKASQHYPWNWAIYNWLEGESANTVEFTDVELAQLAISLANFLKELQQIDISNAPLAGLHNFHRGAHVSVYDEEARSNIKELNGIIDQERATSIWQRAINTKWERAYLWVHGDFASSNILVQDQKLAAVIDFGCMAVGDPACDLVIAYTFLNKESRAIFKEHIGLDQDTWYRARGWALWKACFELVAIKDKSSPAAKQQLDLINEITLEHDE
jgi:aminoglycoside phosphotransferase (APT) family kinase protein